LVRKGIPGCQCERPNEHQVHDRRDQWKQDLKDPDVWHCDKPEGAISRVEQSSLMLPHALERAVRPPETLLGEVSQTVRGLGQTNCCLFVTDTISQLSDLDRKVLVLAERL